MAARRYFVDCSALSDEEYKKVYEYLDSNSFMCNIVLSKNRCLDVVWDLQEPINQNLALFEKCLIEER